MPELRHHLKPVHGHFSTQCNGSFDVLDHFFARTFPVNMGKLEKAEGCPQWYPRAR